mmetsp:Transcript_144418/g.366599  ORF Transcript_144418/g.366599 Transcript_144418/m.366599 type:complete len:218 (-) Transcript_144418:24-677(-)
MHVKEGWIVQSTTTLIFAHARASLEDSPHVNLLPMTTCELLGVNKVGGGGTDTHGDLLAFLDCRYPLSQTDIEVAPVLLTEFEVNSRLFPLLKSDLAEAAELTKCGLQAWEAHVHLGDSGTGVGANIGDLDGDFHGSIRALDVEVLQLELRVGEAKPEGEGGRHTLGVVPSVAHEHILREVRDEVLAPLLLARALARVLLRREALLILLWQRDGQAA